MRVFLIRHRIKIVIVSIAVIIIGLIFLLFSVDNRSNGEYVAFIASFGWEVEPSPKEISHITVPSEFDGVYNAYNRIASGSGFDLTPYRGKNVTRYSYKVLNNAESDTGLIYANVFVYRGEIVSADITSQETGGFTIPISDTSGKIN